MKNLDGADKFFLFMIAVFILGIITEVLGL